MKNFTLKGLFIACLVLFMTHARGQEWNISSASFNALGEVSTTTTVDGLTIYANSEKTVTIDDNNKSLDGMDFTSRLKLGGSGQFDEGGQPLGRVLAFDVTGNTTITIMCMSSSSSSDRELVVAVGDQDTELARMPAMGSELTKGIYNYVGGATTIYLFSPSSGVNVYYVKAEGETPPAAEGKEWNISSADFNALGEISATTTVNDLTIYANSEKTVTIDDNNKSLDGMDFTSRLKLGGSGQFDESGLPLGRVLAFDVTGDTKITIMCMSSSSSSDRELVVAVGDKDTELARMPAMGSELTKGEYDYVGGATTIYLFSPSSGVNVYYIKTEPAATTTPETKEWNISAETFNALGELSATTTVDDLTIYANSEKTVTIDANNKSLDGMDFTHRLKLGGSGAFDEGGLPLGRVLAFDVAGDTKITIMCMSSSSSSDRELVVAVGDKDTELARMPAMGSELTKGEYTYTGGATTIYLYSPSSGVNVYYIKSEPNPTDAKQVFLGKMDVKVYPNPASEKVFVDVQRAMDVAIYNVAGSLLKVKRIESKYDFMDISDLNEGVYIIKSYGSNKFAKKLIVR